MKKKVGKMIVLFKKKHEREIVKIMREKVI